MKKETSSNVLEKIDIAKERIKELETMINLWEGGKVASFGILNAPQIHPLRVAFSLMIDLHWINL